VSDTSSIGQSILQIQTGYLRNPLILLVAGAGFEPTTFGL